MSNLCNEMRSTFSKDKDITSTRCAQMKYLNAVIEESLRMYPPLVTELPRVVPKDGVNVDGYSVPANVSDDISMLWQVLTSSH
jgi:cytochrome P450